MPGVRPPQEAPTSRSDAELIAGLRRIVGNEHCLTRPEDLFAYGCDALTLDALDVVKKSAGNVVVEMAIQETSNKIREGR
ncbi:MAG: hypothetical protein JRE70_12060, partial [Deltaproteobacteria bacterium]|nr:hypothetical protein [Deltaproteobacteria bacterium]